VPRAARKVTGWAMDDNYRTPLITSAVEMAARNLDPPADAVFHSDLGSNYISAEFAEVLEGLGIRQSGGGQEYATTMRWPNHLTPP